MTVIDQVLDGLHLRSTVFSRMTLAGEWGFAKDGKVGAPFHLVLSGEAHVGVASDGGMRRLGPGDVAILPRGEPHVLLAHPEVSPIPWATLMEHEGWQAWRPGLRFKAVDLRYGSGEPVTRLISGVFEFGEDRRNPMLAALPSMMLAHASYGSAAARALSSIADLLDAEIASGQPGAETVAARLADMLFVQALRHHIASARDLPQGWLRGVADPELAAAIALIHDAPDKPWSVASLAHAIGMSRSRFAARFRETVGQAPLEYLTERRMHQAADRLATEPTPLATIAAAAGYRSDVAFSKAFRRWAGKSPAAYRRSLRRPAALPERQDERL